MVRLMATRGRKPLGPKCPHQGPSLTRKDPASALAGWGPSLGPPSGYPPGIPEQTTL